MRVECPYCPAIVDVARLEHHVRSTADGGHGERGTVPVDGVDSPWNLRLDLSDAPDRRAIGGDDVPTVEHVEGEVRRGRCPACERGVLGLKGGNGLLSSGRRRLACPNCGWESPDWIDVVD